MVNKTNLTKILVINAGSSSMKFQLYEIINNNFVISAKGLIERIGLTTSYINIEKAKQQGFEKYRITINIKDHNEAANLLINNLKTYEIIADFNEIKGIGHRMVHGAYLFQQPTLITKPVIAGIKKCIPLAPLHNPAALKGYYAFHELNKHISHVAVFDTAFHTTLTKAKFLYPVPYDWYRKYQVRRYGFHGISYEYIVNKLALIHHKSVKQINTIICHLGNGTSICAVKNGKSYNTSMGLTPLDGLIMGTRSGVIDPSIHEYIEQVTGKKLVEITNTLNKASGLLGISGISSDLRDIIKASQNPQDINYEQATIAITLFVERIANYIIMYANDLALQVDAIVFTAGIGENSDIIRQMVCDKIKVLQLQIDQIKNQAAYDDYMLISSGTSTIAIYKIKTNEEIMICKATYELIKA